MSSTETETSTVLMPSSNSNNYPEITVITRLSSIPVISSSLEKMNGTLSTNAYTRTPYTRALGLSNSAYKLTGPIQAHLAPLIVRADGFANMAVDVVQKRYPSAFTATPEDVMVYVQERQKDVGDYVRKRREGAGVIALDIDKRFAPIVDYFEVAVNRFDHNVKENSALSDRNASTSQYQRALELSTRLRDQLQLYSNEQMKQLQAHSVLVQRATETASSISTAASSSLVNAQNKVSALADNMITELGKLQMQAVSLSDSLQATASNTLKDPAGQLPPRVQQKYQELAAVLRTQASSASQTYEELSRNLSATAAELRGIMTAENISMQEKATGMRDEVTAKVQPLLEALNKNVQQALSGRSESAPSGDGHAK